MSVVVHVGMGKTATTSLQTHVFPRLAEAGIVREFNPPDVVAAVEALVQLRSGAGEVRRLVEARPGLFLSLEFLHEWDPELWEEAADRNLAAFGQAATIVLTLRDHRSYLRSLHQQAIHSGKIRPAGDFLIPQARADRVRRFVRAGEMEVFNVDAFDLRRLVDLHVERFDKVVVVPMEAIRHLAFLRAVFPVAPDILEELRQHLGASARVNVSYSALAMRLTLGREAVLRAFGLRSICDTDRLLAHHLAEGRVPGAVRAGPAAANRRRLRLVSWSRLMRLLTRLGPRAPYVLPPETPLGRHLAENERYYAALAMRPEGYAVHGEDGLAPGHAAPLRFPQSA